MFKRVSIKKLLILFLFIITIGYFLFSTTINEIFINSYDVFMYQYNKGGLLNALLTGRNTFFSTKLEPLLFDLWYFPNIFFGGQDVMSHYIEMGLVDLFLFFGIFGFSIYFYFYYKLFNLLSFNKDFKIFFGLTLLFIIAFAGHFFESGIVSLHFMIMILINRKIDKQIA
jgi:hypothetical protein